MTNKIVETSIKSKWIGVRDNINANSETKSSYVEIIPPSMAWTDNTNTPTHLTQKSKAPTDTIQSQS